MAPHSSNDNINGGSNATHRRAKSTRVAPAIPYALVKPKPSPSSASSIRANKTIETPVAEPIHQLPASPVTNAPLTPTSVSSSHDKTAADVDTLVESLSDRNPDSDDSKPSAVSTTTSPPSTQSAISPKPDMDSHNHFARPSVTMPGPPPGFPNGAHPPPFANGHMVNQTMPMNGANGQFSDHRHHPSHHSNGSHMHAHSNSEPVPPPYLFSTPHNMPPNSATMIPPPGMVPQNYNGGFTSPPSVCSPTSGWNPNANFVPPSHQITMPQRPINGGLSPQAGSHTSSTPDIHPMSNSMGPPSFAQPLPPADVFPWSSYINSFYADSRFADFSLTITRTNSSRVFPEFPTHGIVIAKSPVLSNLIQSLPSNPKRNDGGLKILTLEIDEKLTSYRAVLEAVGHLYGLPLPSFGDALPIKSPLSVLMERMTSALSLAGAGQLLGLPEVMSHGLAFAANSISWVTFEKALAFAQTSMASISSFDHHDARTHELTKLFYHYNSNLLFCLERFLIEGFPSKFEFLASALELSEAHRLPAAVETRQSVSNPRLASIQFGTMPAQDPANLESGILLSSILLSIPTTIIARLLQSPELAKKLGSTTLIELVGEIVDERERRRSKVAKSKRIMPGATNLQWEETKWIECLEQDDHAHLGVRLTRKHVDTEH